MDDFTTLAARLDSRENYEESVRSTLANFIWMADNPCNLNRRLVLGSMDAYLEHLIILSSHGFVEPLCIWR